MIITEGEFEESTPISFFRFMSVCKDGLGANRCNYYFGYGKHLDPCFNEYTKFIKRK